MTREQGAPKIRHMDAEIKKIAGECVEEILKNGGDVEVYYDLPFGWEPSSELAQHIMNKSDRLFAQVLADCKKILLSEYGYKEVLETREDGKKTARLTKAN